MITLPVNDIPELDRRSLEDLLGQRLQADQQVCVMVFSAGKVADDATSRAAVETIRSTLDKVDGHRATRGIAEEEIDAAADEAMEHIRPRPG